MKINAYIGKVLVRLDKPEESFLDAPTYQKGKIMSVGHNLDGTVDKILTGVEGVMLEDKAVPLPVEVNGEKLYLFHKHQILLIYK